MRRAVVGVVVVASGIAAACSRPQAQPKPIRLVDRFDAKLVEGAAPKAESTVKRTEWRFTEPAPAAPAAPPPSPAPGASPTAPAGPPWKAGPGVSTLAVANGLLTGRSTTDFPMVHLERRGGLENGDQVHAIEIRLRASAGTNLSVATNAQPSPDLPLILAQAARLPWGMKTPLLADGQMHTYTLTPPAPVSGPRVRHLILRPTDAANADFAIESVRLVFRREHLAGVPSGVSWQGLRDIFRETLVTRSPEVVRFTVKVPPRPMLDLSVGTPDDRPVTFTVTIRRDGRDANVLSRTVTTPHRWERRVVDLTRYAGEQVTVSLAAAADSPGVLAFWGAPAIRARLAPDPDGTTPPQTVILIQGDTLRTDHLDAYGYERPTAPTLRRMAEEGVLFRHAITQTGWTKAATPSIHTGLYPTTHGVHQILDRLPVSANTIAESFREAGYATLSFSSVSFTGTFTNLHQGFEELHESESTVGRAGPKGSKTAREFVDRLTEWIDGHPDIPVFVYLHFFDPHSPYEPNPPYDTMWADPKGRAEYEKQQEILKKAVTDAFLGQRGMATRDELVKAGIDPEAFIRFSKDWYDGSIRAMDTELARLVERVRERGRDKRTTIAFYADHGEEFHDHGRMWHGQSVYGEMIRVPLVLWSPGRLPKGLRVDEPVELIDVMPTLLEMSGLRIPPGVQGQSLKPLFASAGAASRWVRRPVIAEKQPMGTADFPNAAESYAIIDGGWKLVHHVQRPADKPEFELFDFLKDPRDQKDVAAGNAETVARLARALDAWKQSARQARVKPDADAARSMTAEQLEHLRSLGYVQ